MKIKGLVEEIFAQAVVLDQNGGLRNTIYALGKEIYIMNYDHSILLRFKLRSSEGSFDHPISFKANDYDSNEFEQVDGKVIFSSEKGDYNRTKTCGTSDLSPEEVKELYKSYLDSMDDRSEVLLSDDVLELLDEKLSHIEFTGEAGGGIKLIQRNIYSGGIIEITKKNEGLFTESLEHPFGPVAMKTDDFKSLFYFQNSIKLQFPKKGKEDFIFIKGTDSGKRNFSGIIACCIYDEIIKLKEARDGR